jgi:hypothetical protein
MLMSSKTTLINLSNTNQHDHAIVLSEAKIGRFTFDKERPRKFDVLCGKGRERSKHFGNKRFQAIVELHVEKYRRAGKQRSLKTHVVEAVLFDVRSMGSRFFKKEGPGANETGWVEIRGERAVRDKIGHALRNCCFRRDPFLDGDRLGPQQSSCFSKESHQCKQQTDPPRPQHTKKARNQTANDFEQVEVYGRSFLVPTAISRDQPSDEKPCSVPVPSMVENFETNNKPFIPAFKPPSPSSLMVTHLMQSQESCLSLYNDGHSLTAPSMSLSPFPAAIVLVKSESSLFSRLGNTTSASRRNDRELMMGSLGSAVGTMTSTVHGSMEMCAGESLQEEKEHSQERDEGEPCFSHETWSDTFPLLVGKEEDGLLIKQSMTSEWCDSASLPDKNEEEYYAAFERLLNDLLE